jgi:hypothetical protein
MPEYLDYFTDLVDEDYPPTFSMEEFNKINSYAGKLRYANTHLIKLASGSGRTVFKIDNEKVLKVAKNKRGIAQNEIESERYLQQYDLIARVFDSDRENDYWLEMELAKKVGKKRFEQLSGIKIDELDDYLTYRRQQSGRSIYFKREFSPEFITKMQNNEFISELDSLNADYDFATGDESRLSTWGEVLRGGKPQLVLVDFGLTNNVYNDFYKVELK